MIVGVFCDGYGPWSILGVDANGVGDRLGGRICRNVDGHADAGVVEEVGGTVLWLGWEGIRVERRDVGEWVVESGETKEGPEFLVGLVVLRGGGANQITEHTLSDSLRDREMAQEDGVKEKTSACRTRVLGIRKETRKARLSRFFLCCLTG